MSGPTRSLPMPTPDSAPFWAGCAEGALRMQKCSTCAQLNWFPRGICVNCSSTELEWVDLSGRATVYSFSVVSRPPSTAFPPVYVLALVDLDEGPRMMTHLVEVAPESVHIGMAVTVRFDHQNEEISLPTFAPAG